MIPAPIPSDESMRLAALHASGLIGTPDEYPLNCATNIGVRLFDVPVCLVSLIDAERQWFKSRVGFDSTVFDGSDTARDISLCAHVVAAAEPLIVEDTLRDSRFADNPWVSREPGIRFYAGYPIRGPHGDVLGALCLIDYEPRSFDERQVVVLGELAVLAQSSLSARRISAAQQALTSTLEVARRESLLDPLLRMWNRAGIDAILDRQHATSLEGGAPFSVLMIHIDQFERVNENHGTLVGNRVLTSVVRALRSALRAGDELGRFGGEDFLVMLPDTPLSGAQRLARRLTDAAAAVRVETSTGAAGCTVSIRCSVSIGVAEWAHTSPESPQSMVSRARKAMASAKSRGPHSVCVSQPDGGAPRAEDCLADLS